jgi:hypothetical protein
MLLDIIGALRDLDQNVVLLFFLPFVMSSEVSLHRLCG